jgi:hypothetical protein
MCLYSSSFLLYECLNQGWNDLLVFQNCQSIETCVFVVFYRIFLLYECLNQCWNDLLVFVVRCYKKFQIKNLAVLFGQMLV